MVPNILQVKLVFWRNESNEAFNPQETLRNITNAVSNLFDDCPCKWRNGVGEVFQDAEGDTKISLSIKHNDLKDEDPCAEEAIRALCEYLFLEDQVIALDPILAGGRVLMAPFSESSMIPTDRMFGRYFALQNLHQLQSTQGLGFAMRKKFADVDGPFSSNNTKWFHSAFHAGLCVTNFFMFFNDALQSLDESTITQAEKLSDKDMKDLFEKGKWILRCAKVFASWSPKANSKCKSQLEKLDPKDKKKILLTGATPLVGGSRMLSTLHRNLGNRDPTVSESRRFVGELSNMMVKSEPLYYAANDYIDSCIGETAKSAGLTAAGIIGCGAIIAFPPAGLWALGAYFVGCGAAGGVIGHYGVSTVFDGINLHNARHVKVALRTIYAALSSCRLFLLIVLMNTKGCLDRDTGHYQQFKNMISKQCSADLDQFQKPGYVNLVIQDLVEGIERNVNRLEADLRTL
ncbi:hypothetical protein AA0119_g7282 [Alternaria tenuissima]|uniref:Prion-inhibition and propagation HeLo domain-containing protein n=1 Tax=Alternaria tenuissima TaxID=119927 RepID=A0ABY0G6A7_9PLEO|nr:hypothetical protein AALT_g5580 [Alternaria alternata]RYN97559.1 hypothetical protein AA0119_g7282 [Alternaria tenuissima]RYO15651.1 hypothetical protein AA0121_g6903 [Alternaria tenuissima]RYO62209.1 hypothetical protein AA0116_g4614 [Alternaria tenuissima]